MATDDIRIPINELHNSEMCKQSSNEIGLQISSPSNFNTNTQVKVIEGELVNSIRKPRTKSLEEDPNQLGQISLDSNDWSFFKVPYPLRQVNETAYEPNVISIGPYHHGMKRLETMEVIKRNCFRRMIQQKKIEPRKFVTVMKKLEEEVRKCYEEPLDGFDSDTFVEMMVLDGCFIVLLFQEDYYPSLSKLRKAIVPEIFCDLLLLENQLPYIVLSELYGVITSNVEINVFSRSVFSLLSNVIPGPDICVPETFPKPEEIKHLLGLVHHCWLLSARKRDDAEAEAKETKAQTLRKFVCCGTEQEKKGIERKGYFSRKFILCATELEEAGIKFVNKEKKKKESLFDIEFTNDGKLKIPTLSVDDYTERIFRNFMAYEQFSRSESAYVCEYVVLMDNLINSGKDVQLLRYCGIIDNELGDDKAVAKMFNKLCEFIWYSDDGFCDPRIFNKVNAHCERQWNKWKANLNKDYFNSPWAIISVLAAFVLLLLTLVQAISSVLSNVYMN